eukprot:TRINITY_DN18370_c0_g1_i1.p1 TRINITY_DN18370_c0_g1~~TRINITY_DN18370_c0_g1_i1.p1  ORF type:complete len:334 (+),score=58.76 TRINITY_DN18370_c0_g1_i1:38-1003(+)
MQERAEQLLGLPLTRVGLPGTHDSATDAVTPASKPCPPYDRLPPLAAGIVCRWAQAQGIPVHEQLMRGVRYLDLRVSYERDKQDIFIVHGMLADPLRKVLSAVAAFSDEHPSEFVVVDINHFYNFTTSAHESVLTMISTIFKDNLIHRRTCACTDIGDGVPGLCATLGELWAEAGRVLVCYGARPVPVPAIAADFVWPPNAIASPWPQTADLGTLRSALDEWLAEGGRASPWSHQLRVVQGVLTPDTRTVLASLVGSESLKTVGGHTTARVAEWLRTRWRTRPVNVVIGDWVELCDFIPTVIQHNCTAEDESNVQSTSGGN